MAATKKTAEKTAGKNPTDAIALLEQDHEKVTGFPRARQVMERDELGERLEARKKELMGKA